jgi:hypothetical protein
MARELAGWAAGAAGTDNAGPMGMTLADFADVFSGGRAMTGVIDISILTVGNAPAVCQFV